MTLSRTFGSSVRSRALAAESRRRARGRALAIVSDFDGTLSDLADTPEDAILRRDARGALAALSETCPILVVSGRRLEDLERRVPLPGVALAGEHGGDLLFSATGERFLASLSAPAAEALDRFEEVARDLLAGTPGFVERKRLATAAHTRLLRDAAVRRPVERALARGAIALALDQRHAVEAVAGKMVVELRACGASKDVALSRFVATLPLDTFVVALGDDASDEDLFCGANALGGYTIKVGSGWTCASRTLDDPEEVAAFLRALVDGSTTERSGLTSRPAMSPSV
jgi:trehalose 6-phosphate phosphatase